MTTEKIAVGRIVAKLRNTVPVCLMENGKEVKRYKNIEFPDELKGLEATAFGFVIGPDGKITFHLCFDEGVLPEDFPANRKSISRTAQAAAKAAQVTAEPAEAPDQVSQANPEYRFNVSGEDRKLLVALIGELTGCKPQYQGAPTFAYVSGSIRIDKKGTLTGDIPLAYLDVLADRGFITTEAVA